MELLVRTRNGSSAAWRALMKRSAPGMACSSWTSTPSMSMRKLGRGPRSVVVMPVSCPNPRTYALWDEHAASAGGAPQQERAGGRRGVRRGRPLPGGRPGPAADRLHHPGPGQRARGDRLRGRLGGHPRGAAGPAAGAGPRGPAGAGPAGPGRLAGRARPGAAAGPARPQPGRAVLAGGGGRRRGRAHARGAAAMTAGPVAPADRHGPAAATVLVGALLVLVGIGWLLDAGGVEVPWRALLPAALIAVGLACVAGAFQGRQHALMVVGVALTAVLSVAVAADWDLDVPLAGGVGDRAERPATPAELTEYELGAGDFLLDLQQLQVPPGTTAVQARVGVGELVVELPDGVSVRVVASSGLGEVQVLGEQEGGFANRVDTSVEAGGDRRLELDLRVGMGQVRVER